MSETDHFATYLIDARDAVREAAFSPEKRALLRQWIVARARLAHVLKGGSIHLDTDSPGTSTWMGPLPARNWLQLYGWLDQASQQELSDWSAEISAMERAMVNARRSAKADRDERRYERQAERVDAPLTPLQERRLRGKRVWLYHGTSTAKLDEIIRHGLLPDREQAWRDTTPGYVYLTAYLGDPGGAMTYARRAAREFGGDPTVLRVIVEWDELEPDEDDADLRSGMFQWRIHSVGANKIMEIDGERLR